MNNLIERIIAGEDIEKVFSYVLNNLYLNGPSNITDLEILSYLALYAPQDFETRKNTVLNYMGLFYKDAPRETLKDVVFGQYRKYIHDTFNEYYTPVQASIVRGVSSNKCFSFSAPTSTGKSFVFMNKIKESTQDVVVVVPSRALINEYYTKLDNLITDKSINILTFIDKINTKYAKRNVFIVTPERCRDLFKQKATFTVDLFLFDEAQLSNEDSKRGLYFDSIVRRCQKAFPESTFVFAHPFVSNPESQIEKNHFDPKSAYAVQYNQKNVGQIFLSNDDSGAFFHFGIDKTIMGNQKQKCKFDPIEKTIKNGGAVLFYVSKSKIYKKEFLSDFKKYVKLCKEIEGERIDWYIDELKRHTGGETAINKDYYSQMISLLKKGIVIHHGSLPLSSRIIMEEFTKEGLCRICFATSTLEQGINMPFDVVYLDRLEGSKTLSVKNLIGRAGRSSMEQKFDFGYVIIHQSKMSQLRNIMLTDEELSNVSSLEKVEDKDDDYNEFKEAILNDTYSDEYNLTEKDLEKLTATNIDELILRILNSVFVGDQFISSDVVNRDLESRLSLYEHFRSLYSAYLGRKLVDGERYVLDTAIKIILWKVYGKTFKNICWYRYSHASKSHVRDRLRRAKQSDNKVMASYITGFSDIPDKSLRAFNMFQRVKARDVDYDRILFDTYDYIDKLIGFKLTDVYFAALQKYFERSGDRRANRLAKFIKYGTDNDRHIWMLRYGLSFEDIETLDKHIESIDSEAIIFKQSIINVPESDKRAIMRFLN